jgi:hypothetical protein
MTEKIAIFDLDGLAKLERERRQTTVPSTLKVASDCGVNDCDDGQKDCDCDCDCRDPDSDDGE